MTSFDTIKNIYFLGIGGIGMSALAQYFVLDGKRVAGYDKTPSKITKKLEDTGITVASIDAAEKIPDSFRNQSETLVVYTPAVPQDLALLTFFKEHHYTVKKRAEVLGIISHEIPTLAVAGTHGKTTTSAILAHLLKTAGYQITAFLGGISENYHTNFISDGKEACVVEADEFDRSFLQLSPQYAAITSMDADHLDIYGQEEELRASFIQFANKLPSTDRLCVKKGLPLEGHTVAVGEEADFSIQNVTVENGTYHFDLMTPQTSLKALQLTLPGKHNLMNAGMALAMAIDFGADKTELAKGLSEFKGVERRFSYHIKTANLVLIEDYAHHPEELKAVHQAVREVHPDKKILAVFQPHLYSRTKDFAKAFAESLALFDEVFLLPIYPAREAPIPGIDAQFLLDLIENPHKRVVKKNELGQAVTKTAPEVVLMLGAGDIGNEVENLKKTLGHEV